MENSVIAGPKSKALEYFKLNDSVQPLQFATRDSACFDLRANLVPGHSVKMYTAYNKEHTTKVDDQGCIRITRGDRVLIPSGIIFNIPEGFSLRIHPRSSTGLKLGLTLPNCEGIVDKDYFHECFILLQNTSEVSVVIKDGDRLVQAELVPVVKYEIKETDIRPEQTSDRIGGFGSTGQ